MSTAQFLFKVATLPFKVLQTVLEYYTTGTVYSRTSTEFRSSLWKNICVSVEYYLEGSITKTCIYLFAYKKITSLFGAFRSNPMVTSSSLPHYGEKYTEHSYWLVKNDCSSAEDEEVIVFLHGGGFALCFFRCQFVGLLALYHAMRRSSRKNVSILLVDYSLTIFDKKYPTQIHETLEAYKKLTDDGYKKIHLFAESCGSNLALVVSRFIAYPEEAQKHFSQFKEFDFNFNIELQPTSLVLISPWLEPKKTPQLPPKHGANVDGDLGARDTIMADWYLENVEAEGIDDWFMFSETGYDFWSKVKSFQDDSKALIVYGEREVLRDGIETWINNMRNGGGKLSVSLVKGGIHSGMFYAESLDYDFHSGAKRALRGDFEDKFTFNRVCQFYENLFSAY
ncbi:Piso0_001891 [Millerozyma farinosa CBS 7064]|uniref:Piso0_001891 protein n=1 Tax=Pichia sorbitophila (strain ATCC MYA-4447 / BCRC 22081 / CBS 7064 / NBRC 10061 / NRRL Y-12695) TaxID=559304 RepID=G8YB49_PICSO|nr:Piso0_001891 [Millerozyma farinosa CBS 7064]